MKTQKKYYSREEKIRHYIKYGHSIQEYNYKNISNGLLEALTPTVAAMSRLREECYKTRCEGACQLPTGLKCLESIHLQTHNCPAPCLLRIKEVCASNVESIILQADVLSREGVI